MSAEKPKTGVVQISIDMSFQCLRAGVEPGVEHRIDLGELTHPAHELSNGILIDRLLAFTVEQSREIPARIIPHAERIGFDEERSVIRHVGALAATPDDFSRTTRPDIFK